LALSDLFALGSTRISDGAAGLKTGMLANTAIHSTVAKKIQQHRLKNLVVER